MEINRNQYFMAGLVVLMLGIQFRNVEAFVLNAKCSEFVEQQLNARQPQPASIETSQALFGPEPTPSLPSLRKVQLPKWLGWAMLSVGGVLISHSLAMRRPD